MLVSSVHRVTLFLGIVVVALALSGCAQVKGRQGYVADQSLVSAISPGVDNRASVEKTLGRPTFVSQFGEDEWYYVSRTTRQLAFAKPRPTAQQILRIRFDSTGNVAEIQRSGLELLAKISPEGDKTPTLGRDRGFFDDIFGNIGTIGAPGGAGASGNQ